MTSEGLTARAARVGRCERGGGLRWLLVGLILAAPLLALATSCRTTQSDPQRPGFRVRPGVAFEILSDAPGLPVLDLRQPEEFEGDLGHLRRARNVPLEELPDRLPELAWLQERTFLIYCRAEDACSEEAVRFFLAQGFKDVVLLEGGIEAWLNDGFGTVVGLDGQKAETRMPAESGLPVPTGKSIGDPRHLPEPP